MKLLRRFATTQGSAAAARERLQVLLSHERTAVGQSRLVEVLRVILQERPASIADVVRLTGRAQPKISRSLQLLAGYGLVRLVRTGREVRPEPLVRALQVDLMTATYETEPVAGTA